MHRVDIICAKLNRNMIRKLQQSKQGIEIVKHHDNSQKCTYFIIHHGLMNRDMNNRSLQCFQDDKQRHQALYSVFKNMKIQRTFVEDSYDNIVITGTDIGGTIAEFFATILAKRFPQKDVCAITFAAPRGGGQRYYDRLDEIGNLTVRHHDWNRSYLPTEVGFPEHKQTIWDGNTFTVYDIDIMSANSYAAQLIQKKISYFYQMGKLMSHLSRRNACRSKITSS